MSENLHSIGTYHVTIGSLGRSTVVEPSSKSLISFDKGNFEASTYSKSNFKALSNFVISSESKFEEKSDIPLIESAEKPDNQIEEAQLDLFLDSIFLALEDTDKSIEVMQESIDSNKKDIREMLDRIKELVVNAR